MLRQVSEFLAQFGADLLSGSDADEWRPWFTLAHLQQPQKLPAFQVGVGAQGGGWRRVGGGRESEGCGSWWGTRGAGWGVEVGSQKGVAAGEGALNVDDVTIRQTTGYRWLQEAYTRQWLAALLCSWPYFVMCLCSIPVQRSDFPYGPCSQP